MWSGWIGWYLAVEFDFPLCLSWVKPAYVALDKFIAPEDLQKNGKSLLIIVNLPNPEKGHQKS